MSTSSSGLLGWMPGRLQPALSTAISTVARRRAARRLANQSRLHLACGTHLLEGWANIDIEGNDGVIKLDLTAPLPVTDSSLEFVFCEHFIEHVTLADACRLLQRIHTALRPGGVLRLSTPDLAVLVEHYQSRRLDTWRDVGWLPATACRLLNEGMHEWGHLFVYDQQELESTLRAAGFSSIRRMPWGVSDHAELSKLECRPDHGELIYEATK
jgi:predicted SAM-dependent methyltransferase